MKNFLIKTAIFCFILIGMALSYFFLADGHSDAHYSHFTTPEQRSLVLGTSKAAQALQPQIINTILGRDDIYNYSFTVVHSPYGPAYLESVKNKLAVDVNNGIFILTIDPYSVSSRLEEPNDIAKFRENKTAVAQIELVNYAPNLEYLVEFYAYPYIYILTKKLDYVDDDFLHENGWVEINISMKPKAVKERTMAKIKDYKKKLLMYNFSTLRYNYFEETIKFLKNKGKVFLVRLPVSEPFLQMENAVDPVFDTRIKNTCEKYDLEYLDLTKSTVGFEYTDGNHLYKSSGAVVSKQIGEWIKEIGKYSY